MYDNCMKYFNLNKYFWSCNKTIKYSCGKYVVLSDIEESDDKSPISEPFERVSKHIIEKYAQSIKKSNAHTEEIDLNIKIRLIEQVRVSYDSEKEKHFKSLEEFKKYVIRTSDYFFNKKLTTEGDIGDCGYLKWSNNNSI
jgi:hypothetical protein